MNKNPIQLISEGYAASGGEAKDATQNEQLRKAFEEGNEMTPFQLLSLGFDKVVDSKDDKTKDDSKDDEEDDSKDES